jgi:hypothetical protein
MFFVEQVEHPHSAIGFDQHKPAPLNFLGQATLLISQLSLLGDENGLIALGFNQLVYVETGAADGGKLNTTQFSLLPDQFCTTLEKHLLRAKGVRERGPLLIPVDDSQAAKCFESELVFGHG